MQRIVTFIIISITAMSPFFVVAQNVDVQSSIDAKNAEIQALQNEINQYQAQVDVIANQAQNLQTVLGGIETNQKQLKKTITLTGKKIDTASLTISKNQQQIGQLGQGIASNKSALQEVIRNLNIRDNQSLIELLASQQTVSEFMKDVDQIMTVQSKIKNHVETMRDSKGNLELAQKSLAQKKKELQGLSSQLVDQKKVVDSEQQAKNDLLQQTKNQEAQYQALVADRKKRVAQLNAEIFDYESQLNFTLNTKSLPKEGSAPLNWPLSDVVITQKFGKTLAAKRLYVSGSHSGVDFRAAVGTPVFAVADGMVEGVGNTDTTCPKASFGKWVFIRHNNGLATAYGHLSLIKAIEGQSVKTGDLIGYSGQTGHATGPHLHITVYAASGIDGQEGARVAERASSACKGKSYRMPIAPTNAYLDPLLYFPKANASMFKDGQADAGE